MLFDIERKMRKANSRNEHSLMNSKIIVQIIWNYCSVLRDDGMPYGKIEGGRPIRRFGFTRGTIRAGFKRAGAQEPELGIKSPKEMDDAETRALECRR